MATRGEDPEGLAFVESHPFGRLRAGSSRKERD
jgi:hypothetical protein